MNVSSINRSRPSVKALGQQPQIKQASRSSKADSVIFSGKASLVEELFSAIKSAKEISLYEKPADCVYRSVLNADGSKYALTQNSKKFLGRMLDTYKIIKIVSDVKVAEQKIDKTQFSEFIAKVRSDSTTKILEAHGFQQKNVSSLLKDIQIGLANKSITMWNSSANGFHNGSTIINECFELPNKKLVTLHCNNKTKLREVSVGEDRILLTGKSEIRQFKEILASSGFKDAKHDFSNRMGFA
jgi:hypothetical protein